MKFKRLTSVLGAAALAVSMLAGCLGDSGQTGWTEAGGAVAATTAETEPSVEETEALRDGEDSGKETGSQEFNQTSLEYVKAMGHGWNLGNSFDGVNTDEAEEDEKETAWGNPVVTRELIREVKAKGFDSIRLPLTLYRRYDKESYEIDEEWLARYKEVVDWAVEEGLYVMVNIHHDSWIWLKYWDGDKDSEEYVCYVKLWEQLADYLKEEPEQVCFETINEPDFEAESEEEKQDKLDSINLAAYHAIRDSQGNNGKRMIVMPTMSTNFEKSGPLLELIQGLGDDHIIATVHYYGEWVYSANLGITGFDEAIDDTGKTARTAADHAMTTVYDTFGKNGIGVVIGEYGLLGYDKGETCNQPGEELKYYEYMNELARNMDLCLMFWDNGSGINRTEAGFPWKKPLAGAMLEASMSGRSSYAEGLDTLYFDGELQEDVKIPLTLNGNEFTGILELEEGETYDYDEDRGTLTLKADYINGLLEAADDYGIMADLTFQFSSGADWHEKLVKFSTPDFGDAQGTALEGVTIPVEYNGAGLRRLSAYSGEEHTGPHSDWWRYLENTYAFQVNPDAGTLTMDPRFFAECGDGDIRLEAEFFDGQVLELEMTKQDGIVRVCGADTSKKSEIQD